MGRLTKNFEDGNGNVECFASCRSCNGCICTDVYTMIDKLAHYEDLEEQGRLIEQKHGHWIYKHDEEGNTGNAQYECSECGAGDLHAKSQEVPYCWKCGAKMELKELEGVKE